MLLHQWSRRSEIQPAVDEKETGKETSLKSDDIKDYKFTVSLKSGKHVLSVAFTNDTYKEGESSVI